MNLLPRPLNHNELPGAQHFNQLLEYVQAITPIGSHTVRTQEIGSGTILHAQVEQQGSVSDTFPGWVWVNGNAFYDADLVDADEQIGTAITDNSTDGAKTSIKVVISGTSVTDTASIDVTYEDDVPASPWGHNEYWFQVSQWTVPLMVNIPMGATADSTFFGYKNGAYGFFEVDTDVDIDVPQAMPDGQTNDLIHNVGPVEGEDHGWEAFTPSSTYPAVYSHNPGTTPALTLIEPSSSSPGIFVWQPGNAALEFVELSSTDPSVIVYNPSTNLIEVVSADSEFKYLGRQDDGTLAFNYIQVT